MSQEAQLFMEAMASNEDKYTATTPTFTSASEPPEASNYDKKSTSSSQKPIHNPNRHEDDLLPGVRFVVNRFTLYETKTVSNQERTYSSFYCVLANIEDILYGIRDTICLEPTTGKIGIEC
jgi:hypothetical protein